MQRHYTLLVNTPSSASWNMAVDQALMESQAGWIRLYQWEKPSLSLGYFQPAEDIDLSYMRNERNRLELVRRITGGKAVLHQHEWTYSISAPVSWFPGPLRNSYNSIAKGLQKGLMDLGIETSLQERTPAEMPGGNCFQVPGWYEILHKGKKLVGSAQIRRKGRLLQHGSLLLDKDIPLIKKLFRHEDGEMLHSISLKEITGGLPEDRDIVNALAKGFEKGLQCELLPGELPAELEEKIGLLVEERYGNDRWTFKR